MDYLLVLVAGLFAGTLGGIVGTGSSLVLMPILVVMFGPRHAVPIRWGAWRRRRFLTGAARSRQGHVVAAGFFGAGDAEDARRHERRARYQPVRELGFDGVHRLLRFVGDLVGEAA